MLVSGALAGLGGAFLALVAASIYQEGQTGGRGFIGLAAMIFGNWRPGGLAAGAALFGYTDALQLRGGGESVHALLLLVAIAAGRRRAAASCAQAAARSAAIAAVVGRRRSLAWYLATDEVPGELHRHDARTSPRCWCWRSRPNGCGCPRPTGCPTGEGRGG